MTRCCAAGTATATAAACRDSTGDYRRRAAIVCRPYIGAEPQRRRGKIHNACRRYRRCDGRGRRCRILDIGRESVPWLFVLRIDSGQACLQPFLERRLIDVAVGIRR